MYNMVFSESEVKEKNNYFRNYELVAENILDFINRNGDEEDGGVTSNEITDHLGIRPSCVRRYLAFMMNHINTKKYFSRKRKGSFKYFKTSDFESELAWKDIKDSDIEKVTLNQIGLKDSIYFDDLIEKGETFPNVINILKKSQPKWLSVCEMSIILGVNHKRGKDTIKGELDRCLKCSIKFLEIITEDKIKKYRLNYKYKRHSISDFRDIAKSSFPQDKPHKISAHRIQASNNILSMKVEEDSV